MAAINKWTRSKQSSSTTKKDNNTKNWRDVALEVAIDVAKGQDKCCCQECWVERYQDLSCSSSDESRGGKLSFADALKSLDSEHCIKKRLENALHEISTLELPALTAQVSVQQVVGLIRTSTQLAVSDDTTTSLQVRAMSCLIKLMPQLETSSPLDIFLAVQQPILQKLHWDVFVKSGINFATLESEKEFQSLLDLSFETKHESDASVGSKRKRSDEPDVHSTDNATTHSTILHHLLEAAHLARNGIVRAKHGAVLSIPTRDGTKIIGRGYNHDYILHRSKQHPKNKLNLHSEVHAVANAIQTYGEEDCFVNLFPKATIVIVELASDYGYEASHPCPKCDPMLRAAGIPKVVHTTSDGKTVELDLGGGNRQFLKNENVAVALRAACSEQNVVCKRLEEV
jgi:deoxycytidylate deaminase